MIPRLKFPSESPFQRFVFGAEEVPSSSEVGQPLRDAMDLVYLTGQYPADALKLEDTEVGSGENIQEAYIKKHNRPARIHRLGGVSGADRSLALRLRQPYFLRNYNESTFQLAIWRIH
ncbi:hypothetical protein MPB2EB_0551 [Mycoavidus sp. B2-EB]|nr:hypothetical protein MPB2EB_0551 [Mycoavidus sp. B2-EB]